MRQSFILFTRGVQSAWLAGATACALTCASEVYAQEQAEMSHETQTSAAEGEGPPAANESEASTADESEPERETPATQESLAEPADPTPAAVGIAAAPLPAATPLPAPVPAPSSVSGPLVPALPAPAPAPAPAAATQSSTSQKAGSSAAKDEDKTFNGGMYFDLNFGAVFGLSSSHEWNHDCPDVAELSWTPTCQSSKPLGGLIQGNLGFRFGVIGVEGFGLFSIDFSSAWLEGAESTVTLPSYATKMQIGRVGGAVGGGLRVMNNGGVRVSLGVGAGAVFRHVFTNVSSLDGSSEGYASPLVKADLTLTLAKFFNLGVMGWVEFSREIQVTPKLTSISGSLGGDGTLDGTIGSIEAGFGDVTVFQGPQYFLGPFLGFHFGK